MCLWKTVAFSNPGKGSPECVRVSPFLITRLYVCVFLCGDLCTYVYVGAEVDVGGVSLCYSPLDSFETGSRRT